MDKLRAIKYFLKVAETGSFSVAAKTLGVPASSVSRRIQDLEASLGAVLLQRSTRQVKLTELGSLYLEQVAPAVTAVEDANDIIKQHAKTPSGVLRITSHPGYGRVRLIPALKKFKVLYPDVIIDLELTDRVINLAQNQVDIAIRATVNPPERAVARRISDNHFILVASSDYLKNHSTPKTASELQNHKTFIYRGPNGPLRWQAKTRSGWQELETPTAFISTEGTILVEQALAGCGIGLFPKWGIEDNLASGQLIEIVLEDAEVSISRQENSGIYLLYHRPKYSVQKIRAAVDFLMSELSHDF